MTDIKSLQKLTKPVLVEKCREKGISARGKKDEIIARLLKSGTTSATSAKTSTTVITASANSNGQFCDTVTGLVFDPVTKRAIGTMEGPLTRDKIDMCREMKIPYQLPETLDERVYIYDIIEDNDNEEHLSDLDEDVDEDDAMDESMESMRDEF